jgi:CubicO group peptidase (beta-lactamase class C family)
MTLSSQYVTYLKRLIFWNYPTINDFKKFPYHKINRNDTYFSFKKNDSELLQIEKLLESVEYQFKYKTVKCSFNEFLLTSGTTAFIILKDDKVLYEKYFNNYKRESINTSFSISKSFTSILIGIAINEGYINSIYDKVSDYLPELKNKLSNNLTIEHLLNMSSGIKYNPKYLPWADEPKSYYYPDLNGLVLNSAIQDYPPGLYFKYSNYNTILLGMILHRATKVLPQEYLQNKIWTQIGMEYSATWSTDSFIRNFAKMESGINARSIDFAKFGRLVMNLGRWENGSIVSSDWISQLTIPPNPTNQYYITKNYYPYSKFFNDKRLYYKLGWWGLNSSQKFNDLVAIGNLGQFLYISTQNKLVIVRNGLKWGKINWWPTIFNQIVDKLKVE